MKPNQARLSSHKLLFHRLKHRSVIHENPSCNSMDQMKYFQRRKKCNKNVNTYRKYSNKFFNRNGTISGATTSKHKFRIPINRYSGQKVFVRALNSDGFDFLSHSSRHFLSYNNVNSVKWCQCDVSAHRTHIPFKSIAKHMRLIFFQRFIYIT